MKQLPIEFKKYGYEFCQVWRDEDYAIYSQRSGSFVAFEVFKINKNDEWSMGEKTFEASETVPPSSQWGNNAWTCANISDCTQKVEQMKRDAASRIKPVPDVPIR